MEYGGDLVVCLDELVNRVGRVALGFGDLAVYVVAAALGLGVLLVVCFGVIGGERLPFPVALGSRLRIEYDG